jgi:hypothetical protein
VWAQLPKKISKQLVKKNVKNHGRLQKFPSYGALKDEEDCVGRELSLTIATVT